MAAYMRQGGAATRGVSGATLAPVWSSPHLNEYPYDVCHDCYSPYSAVLAKVPAALAELRRLCGAHVLEDVAAQLAARWRLRRRPSSARSTSRGSRCTPSRSARSRTTAPQSNLNVPSKRCGAHRGS